MTAGPTDRPIMSLPGLRAERVGPETLEAASMKLIGAAGGPGGRAAARRFIAAASRQSIDLSRFWIARQDRGRRILSAALLAPSTGGTGMLFTSEPADAEEARALALVIAGVSERPEGVRLAQALIEPGQTAVRRALENCDYRFVGELDYMKRAWAPVPPEADPAWPEGVSVRAWRPGDDPDVMRALERTYIDTLDCPELCGLRRTEDVLASHRGAGAWDPALWRLVFLSGEPEGVLCLSDFPQQGHAELVYLGLGPKLRGMGLGGKLLRLGLRLLADRKRRDLTCAVDARNAPARALYERHGFHSFARRVALVRPLGEAPPTS